MAGLADTSALIALKWYDVANRVRGIGRHSKLKLAVIAVFGIGFWFIVYRVFREGFRFIALFGDFADTLTEYLLSIFFFSLTFLLVFSNGIIAYFSLFKSEETGFLMTLPVRNSNIYLFKLTEALVFSSWAFLFLGTPILVAYGSQRGAAWHFYVLGICFYVFFLLVPAGLGAAAALLVARFVPRTRKALLAFVALLALAGVAYATVRIVGLRRTVTPFTALWLRAVLDQFGFAQNPMLPSYWLSKGISALGAGEMRTAWFLLLVTLSNGLFLTLVVSLMANRWLLTGRSLAMVRSRRRAYTGDGVLERFILRVTRGTERAMWLVIIKDIKTFLRDAAQWSQFLLFFGLLGVYFFNLRTLRYHVQFSTWKNSVAFLNLGATVLTLATFTSRFVFPQISLEGRKLWILGTMPIERKAILFSKFAFAFSGTAIVSVALVVTSGLMLSVTPDLVVLHVVTAVAVCLGLAGLSVGLGALYPNFREDNPSKIVAGFGGTLNLVASLFLIGAVILVELIPCHWYFQGRLGAHFWSTPMIVAFCIACAICLAATLIPMFLGLKALKRLEV